MPTISVVLCTYNRASLLEPALLDLLEQELDGRFDLEIVAVDDASTDGTWQLLQRHAAEDSRVQPVAGGGGGYTRAIQSGFEASSGEWIAYFDDDERTHPRWLLELFDVAVAEQAELVGGPVRLSGRPEDLAQLGPVVRALYGEHPAQTWNEGRKTPLPAGGNRLVHRRVLEELDGYDQDFESGGADRDLVLRAVASGYRIGWSAEGWIEHLVPPDRVQPQAIKRYSHHAGFARAVIDVKHHGWWYAVSHGIARFAKVAAYDVLAAAIRSMRQQHATAMDHRARVAMSRGYWEGLVRTARTDKSDGSGPAFRELRQES